MGSGKDRSRWRRCLFKKLQSHKTTSLQSLTYILQLPGLVNSMSTSTYINVHIYHLVTVASIARNTGVHTRGYDPVKIEVAVVKIIAYNTLTQTHPVASKALFLKKG